MPVCYMLIGLPGSGKSTFVEKIQKIKNIKSISTDEYIEKVAKEKNLTYTDVYQENIKPATKWFNKEIATTIESKYDFIWDQTNLNKKSRKHKIDMLLKNNYQVYAVCFDLPKNIVLERIKNREISTGKKIPYKVFTEMYENFEKPEISEGFNNIEYIVD